MTEIKGKTIGKIIGGFLLVIFLGALGSGLWQKLLCPILGGIFKIFVELMGKIFIHYKDLLYKTAAEGFHEEHSLFLYIFFLTMITGLYLSFILAVHSIKKEDEIDDRKRKIRSLLRLCFPESKTGKSVLTILYGSFIVASIFLVMQASYSNKITTYSLNSIEILAPYMAESEIKSLKSEFLRITSAEKFYKFDKTIKGLAEKYNIELPKLKPL